MPTVLLDVIFQRAYFNETNDKDWSQLSPRIHKGNKSLPLSKGGVR